MVRRRPRHQVVLQLMPGAEPWVRVETAKGAFKLPAQCSLLELWEELQSGRTGPPAQTGTLMVRVPLDQVLESRTVGFYRKSHGR